MRYLICLIIYVVFSLKAAAQYEFHSSHYTDENGLPQNTVNFITSDNAGFIWLATEDGLVRFDGNNFKRYNNKDLQTVSSRFRAFYKDKNRLLCHTSKYEQVQLRDGKAFPDTSIGTWLQNQINLTVQPKGIYKKGFEEAARILVNGATNMNHNNLESFKEIYILKTADSLYRYNKHQIFLFCKGKLSDSFDLSAGKDCKFFVIKNQLFCLRANGAVTNITARKSKSIKFSGDILNTPSFTKGEPKIFLLWNISVRNHVILYLDKSFFLATISDIDGSIHTKLLFRGFNAPQKNICSAYYDTNSGILFLGSSTKGLFVLSPKKFTAITSDSGENIYYGQVEYQPNKILTTGPRTVNLSRQPFRFSHKPAMKPMTFFSMIKDRMSADIWSIWHEWLYLLSDKTLKKIKSWKLPLPINVICQDPTMRIWLGTIGGGLYVKPARNSPPVLFGKFPGRISYILPPDGTNLYIGTENGLYKCRLSDGTKHLIEGLENKSIRNIFRSQCANLWVTTYGNGFYFIENDRAIPMPLDINGYFRSPHYILEDHRGYFWIPTNKGLFQVAESDLLSYIHNKSDRATPPYYYYYDKNNGFNTNEFNGGCEPCAVKLNNGLVSLPSMNGLVLFNPDSIAPLLPEKGLYIDKITVDSAKIGINGLTGLSEDFTQLNIWVSTPFFGDQRNLHMTYALVTDNSKDTSWLPLSADGIISFSMLPSGSYHLVIRKKNGFGPANYIQKVLPVTIHAKWFHSLWFGLILIFLLPVFGIAVGNSRAKYIAKKNKALEALIDEKTKSLKKRANMQELIIQAIGHDIRTPLKYHILLSNKITEQAIRENSALVQRSEMLSASSRQIYQLIENFLRYLKVQNSTAAYRRQNIILNHILSEKLDFFQEIAQKRSTLLLNIGTIEIVVDSDPQLVAIIIHNLLDNALKVVQDGLITTEVGLTRLKAPFVSITDSGPGLDHNILEWLNDSSADYDKTQELMPHKCGLGLLMVKQLAILLKIKILVDASPNNGTTFTLLFERQANNL